MRVSFPLNCEFSASFCKNSWLGTYSPLAYCEVFYTIDPTSQSRSSCTFPLENKQKGCHTPRDRDLNKMTLISHDLISFWGIKITQMYNQMLFVTSVPPHHTQSSSTLPHPTPQKSKAKQSPLAVSGQPSIQFTAGTISMYSACHNKTTV